jgi:hypothetical protein
MNTCKYVEAIPKPVTSIKINHGLNCYPIITAYTDNFELFLPVMSFVDDNSVILDFKGGFIGTIICISTAEFMDPCEKVMANHVKPKKKKTSKKVTRVKKMKIGDLYVSCDGDPQPFWRTADNEVWTLASDGSVYSLSGSDLFLPVKRIHKNYREEF